MPIVRIHNHEVVITEDMIKGLHPKEGDLLEVQEVGGVIVMSKVRHTEKETTSLSYFGAGKDNAQFEGIKEVDDFIRNERKSWSD
jgi:hypothetical protein